VNSEESHGTAGLGVSALGLQTTKPGHRWNQCVTGHWAISRECQAPGTPLLTRGEVPVLFVPQELRSVVGLTRLGVTSIVDESTMLVV